MTFDNHIGSINKDSSRSEKVLEDRFVYIPLPLLSGYLEIHGQHTMITNYLVQAEL